MDWKDVVNKGMTMIGVGVLVGIETYLVVQKLMDVGVLTVTITAALASLGVHTSAMNASQRAIVAMRAMPEAPKPEVKP